MDIPASIVLLFIYSTSLYATFTKQAEVYLESIFEFTIPYHWSIFRNGYSSTCSSYER